METFRAIRRPPASVGTRPGPGRRPRAILLITVGLTLIGAAAWWIVSKPARDLRTAETRLAEAYSRDRAFEFRMPGAAYATIRPDAAERRGLSRSIPLLEAESLIGRRLAKDRDNAPWLRLRARAEMLDQDPESAIATLQHALEQQPEAPDMLADLGVAYALRADAQKRDVDFGYAIDYLGRSLKAKPNSPVATFNQAILYERMYLYEEAIAEWRRYLELDTAGPWREEARRRMSELERKKAARLRRLAQISDKDPDLLLSLLDAGQQVESESYLDIAIVEWLPRLGQDSKYDRALSALATRLEQQHNDRWLRDVLATRRSSRLTEGLAVLSEAVRANLADESDLALAKSVEAADRLNRAANRAGAMRAEFEQVYALHRTVRSAGCAEKAAGLEREASARRYSWIEGQALLEQGNCRSLLGDLGAAQSDMARALEFVRGAGYADLELRATGILADLQTEAGNLLAAWNIGRGGLAKYWSGSYSGIREHQIYLDLMRSSEILGFHETAYISARAAATAIAETPRRRTEASARAKLAELAIEAGWLGQARQEFDRASRLFEQLRQTADREYRTVAELYRAQADIAVGTPQAALERLEPLRPSAENAGGAIDRIRYEQVLADSFRASARPDDAEAAYRRTIDWIADRLNTIPGFRDRAQLMLVAGKAYRGLLGLLWDRGDVTGAWRLWEAFRASQQSERRGGPNLDQRRQNLRNETFLSYVVLPGVVVAWLFDDRGIEGWRLKTKPEELETIASRFLQECADRASNLQLLRRDGRLLYDALVAPAARRLNPVRTLVIEPDGAIGAIPMQALVDSGFHYLGERFAVTIADGLADYQIRAAAGSVSAGARALVVASPRLSDKMAQTFPVLAEAMREGRSTAARFPGSVLLTGQQATLAALEEHGRDAELFHFAGHGFSNAGNGGLLLSLPQGNSDGAAVLDGDSMVRQDWSRCRLAVLSACSTGTGETSGPVNPESLVRGLLWAGVARVVATRWNTDSETSVSFMDQFYTNLLGGEGVSTALQKAAARLRENNVTTHPYYWAAFQSFGAR